MSRFYSQDGLCFDRCDDGSVLVEVVEDGANYTTSPTTFSTTIPASAWASIVSSMSAAGENYDTWLAALKRQTEVSK